MEGAEIHGGGWGGRGRVPELGFRWLKLWIERMGGVPQRGQSRQRLRGGDEWAYVLRATVPPTSPRGLPCPNSARSHLVGACPTPAGTQASSQYELRFGLACSWVPVRFHMTVLPLSCLVPCSTLLVRGQVSVDGSNSPPPNLSAAPNHPRHKCFQMLVSITMSQQRQATSSWVFLAWE